MSFTTTRSRTAVGGALVAVILAAGTVAVLARTGGNDPTETATAAASIDQPAAGADTAGAPVTQAPAPAADPTTTVAPDTTVAPKAATTPTTAARTTPKATTPTTAVPKAGSTATTQPAAAAPVTPQFTPGQRINPTSAQVQAAITSLHQRIPLFQPNEAQFRTFADATCSQFDQGQTLAQVQSTVQQAVTYIQGASLSSADAAFAVKTVVQLRCPGYPA